MKIKQLTHIDFSYFSHTFVKVSELPVVKLMLSIFTVAISFIFNGELHALYSIVILISLDTVTGFLNGWKENDIDSRVFYRVAIKFLIYIIMMVSGRLADKVMPKPFLSPMLDTFLVVTELISILENCGKLGVPVPKFIMDKLKKAQGKIK